MNQILGIMTLTRPVWCCECLVRKQKHKNQKRVVFCFSCLNNAQTFSVRISGQLDCFH